MFKHEKMLFHPVAVEKPNPQYAALLQEQLAMSDWYTSLAFARRPVIHLLEVAELPNLIIKDGIELDYSFATALGLMRVGTDTLAGAPKENRLKARLDKILQN